MFFVFIFKFEGEVNSKGVLGISWSLVGLKGVWGGFRVMLKVGFRVMLIWKGRGEDWKNSLID